MIYIYIRSLAVELVVGLDDASEDESRDNGGMHSSSCKASIDSFNSFFLDDQPKSMPRGTIPNREHTS
jgi:hypothetical protein